MSPSADVAATELLVDAMSATYLPAQKQAGWKRDQYMRRAGAIRLTFIGEVMDTASAAAQRRDRTRYSR